MSSHPILARAANTTAIILAAGYGSRLRPHTDAQPKCLVPVAGRSILDRILDALTETSITDALIVTGYQQNLIAATINGRVGIRPRLVTNSRFAESGTALSLACGLDALHDDRHLLIIEGDVVFEPALLATLLTHKGDMTTALQPFEVGLSGSFAVVDATGGVVDWLHETHRSPGSDLSSLFKTVNLHWFSDGCVRDVLRPAILATLREDGGRAPMEYAMRRVVGRHPGAMRAVLTSNIRWWEVDDAVDLERANAIFAAFEPVSGEIL